MKIKKKIMYRKPNMGALHGVVGISILKSIRNASKPDHTKLIKECDAREKRILAAIKNGTY